MNGRAAPRYGKWMDGGAVVMIDQTRLPTLKKRLRQTCRTYEEVAAAIRDMVIRGAPAIGVAAAMGVALGVAHADGRSRRAGGEICDTLAARVPPRSTCSGRSTA
jgi:methylthioribose-1-phosphate isomerase